MLATKPMSAPSAKTGAAIDGRRQEVPRVLEVHGALADASFLGIGMRGGGQRRHRRQLPITERGEAERDDLHRLVGGGIAIDALVLAEEGGAQRLGRVVSGRLDRQ